MQAPDVAFWNRELASYRGQTWLEAPWNFAEAYFYRRLLEAVRYFQPGPWAGHDPFEKQKRGQEEVAVERLAEAWGQLADVEPAMVFEALLHSCLWGNRADLSNYTVSLQAHGGLMARQERRNILIDHTDKVRELLAGSLQRMDFVNDNVGMELLFDLALADFLLVQGWVREVVFHLKDRPFFVSDAMPKDVRATISLLQAELARSNLVILKGDVNYRRLLDDCHWPHVPRMEEIAAYFPASFPVLRTLKGGDHSRTGGRATSGCCLCSITLSGSKK